MDIVNLAQMVEVDYIGSPCGKLDQVMIYFAKGGMGTYFNPVNEHIEHFKFGGDIDRYRVVCMDTGTKRAGLEVSTYKVRRQQCDRMNAYLQAELGRSLSELFNPNYETDFLSIIVMIVSSFILVTFLMHRIRNVLTNRVLKKSLGDQGTWLPIKLAVTYVYTLPLPSVADNRTQPIAY
jgi:hypothetical protein